MNAPAGDGYIPAHAAVHAGWRRAAALIPGPLWNLLPPRLAAALCSCGMCRGTA